MVCGHQNQLGIEKLPYQFYLKQKDNVQSIWAQIYLENKSWTMPLHTFIPMHHSLGNF